MPEMTSSLSFFDMGSEGSCRRGHQLKFDEAGVISVINETRRAAVITAGHCKQVLLFIVLLKLHAAFSLCQWARDNLQARVRSRVVRPYDMMLNVLTIIIVAWRQLGSRVK